MKRRRDNLLIVLSDEGLLDIISMMLIHQSPSPGGEGDIF
jgi:hypothetical protein